MFPSESQRGGFSTSSFLLYGRLRWKFILRGKNNKKPSYVEGATKIGQNYPVIHLRRAHSNDGGTVIIAN